jgi:hypothetical protein
MPYKLKLNKTIKVEPTKLQAWAKSPVGWWKVTTEGDCEGRTTDDLGTHYGHVCEIALSLKGSGYKLRFQPAKKPQGVYGSIKDWHVERQIVAKAANIALDPINYKGGEKAIAEWLDCPEVIVKPCNYYGAYTIALKD